ncbi:TonB-dependent receptor [Sphingomonas sp. MMS24-J13]|uniref:TonB-dependent receptor n=1 Tax=Sphingomonas sp. MMS24-J13 TaxID=3238686 RepID=UPI00384AD262
MAQKRPLAAIALVMGATPAFAQTAPATTDIIVTATRRASPLVEVPIAVTAVTAQQLAETGATDIRQLNQLVPSLLVSSTSNEAGGGGARIRGIGTVGDNVGLESSVATFVDGVYRSRSGVALTELGPLDRIEVLRGPQGSLFGRNASAGLINIVTAQPSLTQQGYGEIGFGNYASKRIAAGLTGPVTNDLAYRLDGVWTKRDGFIKEAISGRTINNRDRWLARGKLEWTPHDGLSLLLSADYSKRNEECCAGVYLTAQNVTSSTPGVGGGNLIYSPSTIAALMRGITSAVPGGGNGTVNDDTYARTISLTPGRSFRQDVRDYGVSAELNAAIGAAKLTSITAWRGNDFIKGQDADFTSLDLLVRASDGSGYSKFRTFTQELRLQGDAFAGRVDWLVGGYFSHERLRYADNMAFGSDFDRFASARIGAVSPALAIFPNYGFANLNGFAQAYANAQVSTLPAGSATTVANAVASQVVNTPLNGTGENDRFRQTERNIAIFTHDIVNITDRLSLTLGARYTDDRKTLNTDFASTSGCGAYAGNITRLRALATSASADPAGNGGLNANIAAVSTALAQSLANFTGFACVANSVTGSYRSHLSEGEWSGTAVLSYKPVAGLMTYASFSRGYKAGGFNLDTAALFNTATLAQQPFNSLAFKPEKVNSWELGAKYGGHAINLSVALFYEQFDDFQLNTYNGLNFFVSNIEGCKTNLGNTDSDAIAGNSACSDTRSGVTSKGIELEASARPLRDVMLAAGFTYADTRYRKDIVGSPDANGNNSLQPTLFLLPGNTLSNAPKYVATGSASYTPMLTSNIKALIYADIRYTGKINTGSDLVSEKAQKPVTLVNARLGIGKANGRWSVELWAQNLFDVNYKQIAFSMPLQGGGSGTVPGTAAAVKAFGSSSTQLYGAFLGEPRTWGGTLKTKF